MIEAKVRHEDNSFNSKLVRLEEVLIDVGNSTYQGFNSKLVRLEVEHELIESSELIEFQFQTGAIRSQITQTCDDYKKVSIPNWCD